MNQPEHYRRTLSISLPAALEANLRRHADEQCLSLSKLFQRLLEQYLEKVALAQSVGQSTRSEDA